MMILRNSKLNVPMLMLVMVSGSAMAQMTNEAMESIENREEIDMALSIPSKVVIEAIDIDNNAVRIDRQWYRLLDIDSRNLSRSQALGPIEIGDLRAGMEVFIQTDGTEASRSHRPLILDIWSE